jgi:hypothetical protein
MHRAYVIKAKPIFDLGTLFICLPYNEKSSAAPSSARERPRSGCVRCNDWLGLSQHNDEISVRHSETPQLQN